MGEGGQDRPGADLRGTVSTPMYVIWLILICNRKCDLQKGGLHR